MINHIGFIMDGNRRYSKKNNISLSEGYKKGMDTFLKFVSYQIKYNIYESSFFALSGENVKERKKDELIPIYELLKKFYTNKDLDDFFIKNKIKLSIKGNLNSLENQLFKLKIIENKKFINSLKEKLIFFEKNIDKEEYRVNICINYSGQSEILHAFNEILTKINKKELNPNKINENTIKSHIWFNDSKAPEIIVRPGNSPRISGFMLWDSAYSELFFTKKLWPELDESDFVSILNWFKNLERNFGK